jgi:hypothetical protein
MRATLIIVLSTTFIGGAAVGQIMPPNSDLSNNPAANSAAGRPTAGAPKQQPQPQGHPGPTNTTTGGAPASSPQGDSPPGMQPHPNDRKQDVAPKK